MLGDETVIREFEAGHSRLLHAAQIAWWGVGHTVGLQGFLKHGHRGRKPETDPRPHLVSHPEVPDRPDELPAQEADAVVAAGCPPGPPHRQLHLRLEQRHRPQRPAGSMQARPVPALEVAEHQEQRGELPDRHARRPGRVRSADDPDARGPREPQPGRVVRHDVPVVLHEGREPRIQGDAQLGAEAAAAVQHPELHRKSTAGESYLCTVGALFNEVAKSRKKVRYMEHSLNRDSTFKIL
ncbi:hypothetical protein AVEN_27304-1 [Araneus ventricosus]|uniref:Uncharacterized protein n=1 Tax=Araneus ventricosus TaxID=182803 RepID=A0A4Y2LL03_ARAVE|nr:hypothetical protein AVEN_27304-1 [Araneus ventricosus]